MKLSKQVEKNILKSEEEIKEGKTVSLSKIKKRLES